MKSTDLIYFEGYAKETIDAIDLCKEEMKFWNKKGILGQNGLSPMEVIANAI